MLKSESLLFCSILCQVAQLSLPYLPPPLPCIQTYQHPSRTVISMPMGGMVYEIPGINTDLVVQGDSIRLSLMATESHAAIPQQSILILTQEVDERHKALEMGGGSSLLWQIAKQRGTFPSLSQHLDCLISAKDQANFPGLLLLPPLLFLLQIIICK